MLLYGGMRLSCLKFKLQCANLADQNDISLQRDQIESFRRQKMLCLPGVTHTLCLPVLCICVLIADCNY